MNDSGDYIVYKYKSGMILSKGSFQLNKGGLTSFPLPGGGNGTIDFTNNTATIFGQGYPLVPIKPGNDTWGFIEKDPVWLAPVQKWKMLLNTQGVCN